MASLETAATIAGPRKLAIAPLQTQLELRSIQNRISSPDTPNPVISFLTGPYGGNWEAGDPHPGLPGVRGMMRLRYRVRDMAA